MASMRDIKRRKGSIQSTQQITKAMKLVSTVKLQRAKQRAEQSKAYFNCMYETVTSMLARTGGLNHPYLRAGQSGKKAVVVITSNRGLAGGYNSNVIKLITKGDFRKEDLEIYAIGKKGKDALQRGGYHIVADDPDIIEEPSYVDAMAITDQLLKSYADGEVGEIYLAYTGFKNTVVHEPTLLKLLPVEAAKEEESAQRMQAMDSATSNAEEMIDQLSLMYNRARQGSITQELTEIIAGANAIS